MISTLIKTNQGFSLIEVMVAMLIFTVVTSGFALIFTSAVRNNQVVEEMSNSIREAASSIDRELSVFMDRGTISEEMIIDDSARINIIINDKEINISGYIVEGNEDASNRAFFPERLS